MPILTQSLEYWLFKYHREEMALILFGHLELFTEELQQEYLDWCLTNEGKRYLNGGDKYDPEHKGNKALNEALGDADNA